MNHYLKASANSLFSENRKEQQESADC